MSDDIVERLRDYAKSYRGGFGTTGNLLFEAATEIERLEAELAEANAKIEAARALHASTRGLPKHDDLAKFWCDECGQPSPCNTLDALESAPKPTLKENNVGS